MRAPVFETQYRSLASRDSNPGIPNPGIGDALIPGFRDYEK